MSNSMADITKMFGTSGQPARPNLFKVIVPFMGRDFEFKVRAASMPQATVEKKPVSYLNRQFNIAGDRTYDDWVVTIYNDENHEVRGQMLEWQAMTHAMGVDIHGDTPAAYKKNGEIHQISRDAKTVTAKNEVVGIWPTIVGEVPLDWDTRSEVEFFDVTFAIDWWVPMKA